MKVHRLVVPVSFWRPTLETIFLHRLVHHHWFSLIDLLLVIVSGFAWIWIPDFGIWFTLVALLPWGLRLLGKVPAYQGTPFDWLIAILLVTAWVGYWAAYDKVTAWTKAWLIVTAILLYFALSAQPKRSLELLSLLSFGFAVGLSIHFFMTYEFADNPTALALWWTNLRPNVNWLSIPHGYTSGLIAITGTYALYAVWNIFQRPNSIFSVLLKLVFALGVGLLLLVFILTMSRGILAAGAAVAGVWFLWKILDSKRWITGSKARPLFPALVVLSLVTFIVIIYAVLANVPGGTGRNNYGNNSREELLGRGVHLLVDYPITGAGLNSFPGLYSQYMLVIPFYYFANSYNLFLDVTIEQGLMGGLAFLFLCLGSIWLVSETMIQTSSSQIRRFSWLSLSALLITVVHGLFYDYLYNDKGAILLLFPVGIAMIGVLDLRASRAHPPQFLERTLVRNRFNINKVLVLVVVLVAILAWNHNKLTAIWLANLGAVKMSQIELNGFPTSQWAAAETASGLTGVEDLFLSALSADPNNQTANHRLGLISMIRQDFDDAAAYLEKAYEEAPDHRGIIKSLAYCYVWLGKTEEASVLLAQIPESKNELKVYIWWWGTQSRADLAEKASIMVSTLE